MFKLYRSQINPNVLGTDRDKSNNCYFDTKDLERIYQRKEQKPHTQELCGTYFLP
jgi:hypothetical protein